MWRSRGSSLRRWLLQFSFEIFFTSVTLPPTISINQPSILLWDLLAWSLLLLADIVYVVGLQFSFEIFSLRYIHCRMHRRKPLLQLSFEIFPTSGVPTSIINPMPSLQFSFEIFPTATPSTNDTVVDVDPSILLWDLLLFPVEEFNTYYSLSLQFSFEILIKKVGLS